MTPAPGGHAPERARPARRRPRPRRPRPAPPRGRRSRRATRWHRAGRSAVGARPGVPPAGSSSCSGSPPHPPWWGHRDRLEATGLDQRSHDLQPPHGSPRQCRHRPALLAPRGPHVRPSVPRVTPRHARAGSRSRTDRRRPSAPRPRTPDPRPSHHGHARPPARHGVPGDRTGRGLPRAQGFVGPCRDVRQRSAGSDRLEPHLWTAQGSEPRRTPRAPSPPSDSASRRRPNRQRSGPPALRPRRHHHGQGAGPHVRPEHGPQLEQTDRGLRTPRPQRLHELVGP